MTPYEELELALTHLARAGEGIVALGQGPQGRYISAQARSLSDWSRAQGLTDDVDNDRPSALRERLAAYAHEAWSGWMRYLFDKSSLNGDNSVTIPAWAVERWTRQMRHTYEALPEEEKASDRAEAEKMLAIMRGPQT